MSVIRTNRWNAGRLWLILSLMVVALVAFSTVSAQEQVGENTEASAIAIAAASEGFAGGLEAHPGWTAAAYDTRNAYGIWRVQFWDAAGEDLGWADVNPVKGKVYSYESHVGVTDAQRAATEPVLREYIASAPEITELMENPGQYEMYIDRDNWSGYWGVYIARPSAALYVVVDFADEATLRDPYVVRLYFEVMSYDEWFSSTEQLAVAKAFEQPEIAAAINGVEGWEATSEREGDLWTIYFMQGDQELARAVIDMANETILSFSIAS